jgi:hypothetical protein
LYQTNFELNKKYLNCKNLFNIFIKFNPPINLETS